MVPLCLKELCIPSTSHAVTGIPGRIYTGIAMPFNATAHGRTSNSLSAQDGFQPVAVPLWGARRGLLLPIRAFELFMTIIYTRCGGVKRIFRKIYT